MSTQKKLANSGSASRITALVVAESFAPKSEFSNALYPLVPEVPLALLRVCDVPLIDYVLENLVSNGVDTVYVLMGKSSYAPVVHHMQTVRSSRGKAWCDCREMRVVPVESRRALSKLFDVVEEVVDRNLIPEEKSFLWVPIDCLTNMSTVRDMFSRHEERVESVGKYAATMITCKDDMPLRAALEAAIVEQAEHHRAASDSHAPTTPVTSQVFPGVFHAPQQTNTGEHRGALDLHRMVLVHDRQTGIVQHMQRCERSEASSGRSGSDGDVCPTLELPPLPISVTKKSRIAVRTDLVYFGVFIVGPGALSLFKFFHNDPYDMFHSILANSELEGNSFAVEVCPRDTIYAPLRTVPGYLHASWCVMNRLLYPLTRESNFADQRAHFAVTHESHTIYSYNMRTEGLGCHGSHRHNIVVGDETVTGHGSRVSRSVLGNHVVIGSGCSIDGCIVLDHARIGNGCVLRDTVVCSGAVIGDGVELGGFSVVGSGVKVESSAGALCLDGVRLERCSATESDAFVVGDRGVGRSCNPQQPSTVVPLSLLFTSDAIPASHPDDDDDDEAEPAQAFYHAILDIVEQGIKSPSRIENYKIEMRNLRLSYGKTNGELSRVVIRILLEHAMKKAGSITDQSAASAEALEVSKALIAQWCRPFFVDFVSTKSDMFEVLLGLCVAIQDPACLLHNKAPKLLEWLYNRCDDELYDEREYCVVSGAALLEFDAHAAELEEEEDQSVLDEEDKAVVRIGALCINFIENVRNFLNS